MRNRQRKSNRPILHRILVVATAVCTTTLSPDLLRADEPPISVLNVDIIRFVEAPEGQPKQWSGAVENIVGDHLLFRRRGAASPVSVHLQDLEQVSYARTAAFDLGLQQLRAGDFQLAVRSLEQALQSESRAWVLHEVRASLALARIGSGARWAAVRDIGQIHSESPETRHVHWLPLVWSDDAADTDRLSPEPQLAAHDSAVIRLAAASSLLHLPEHRIAAIREFEKQRRSEKRNLATQAELQLWRAALESSKPPPAATADQWFTRAELMTPEQQVAARFLIGRLLESTRRHDAAAVEFLWTAFGSPADPALCSAAQRAAVRNLNAAGRLAEARRLAAEWQLPVGNSAEASGKSDPRPENSASDSDDTPPEKPLKRTGMQ